ncbi:MAG TPA: putative toxin-antitoxin system toxin component, PIN family [Terracidiphilus sp.]|jgi:putative PIN family toxin of toxin-antitoxin system
MIRRVVLDTSTLVSAAIRIGSTPHRALLHAFATSEVCASVETLEELGRVLDRPTWDAYADAASRREFVALYRRNVRLFLVQESDRLGIEPRCRDPRDDQFLALVAVAEAHFLVSSDHDLLVMHPWRGVPILTPAGFLSSPDQP